MNPGLGIIVAGLAVFAFIGIATAGAAGAAGGLGGGGSTTATTPTTGGSTTKTTGPVTGSGSDRADIRTAGAKWGVPTWILWGVYGLETSYGSNVTTSSAGAIGKMQFIPSTAASYNYPQTNSPNAQQSAQQFDSAAHLLHDLFHQYGSWAEAITHYSGGGYTLSSVQAHSTGHP